MKKRIFSLITILAMLCTIAPMAVVNAATTSKPSVGDGSEDNPYEIGTVAELLWFADRVNYRYETSLCAILTADIALNPGTFDSSGTYTPYASESAEEWTPIGTESYPYSGTFDGANHTISGIYFNDSGTDYVGLFGYTKNAVLKNIGVSNSYIRGYNEVGGIVGRSVDENSSDDYGLVTNCYNSAIVKGYSSVGGIVGYAYDGAIIEKCINYGIIMVTTTYGGHGYTGGIVGYDGTINNCYNVGNVTSNGIAGGISGYGGSVNNCYNIGSVTCDGTVGSISGDSEGHSVVNCYYLKNTANSESVGVGDGGASAKAVSSEYFASGEIAYLLQQGQDNQDVCVWGQYIGYEDYPTLGGKMVFYNSDEDSYYNLSSIALDSTALSLNVGDGAALGVTLSPSSAQESIVTWSSSNTYVATVSSSGKVLGIGAGTAVITATAGEKAAYCVVTVTEEVVDVIAVTLDKSELSISAGNTAKLTASVLPDDATDKTVTWTSSDTDVATVSGGTVTGVAEGSAVITASAGAQSASCVVTVTAPVATDAPDSGEYPYLISGLSILNESGEELDSAPSDTSFIVNASFIKTRERDAKDYIFVAVYDTDGALLSIDYVLANFTVGTEYSVGFHICKQDAEIGSVKAFVWNTFDSMEPLAESIEL